MSEKISTQEVRFKTSGIGLKHFKSLRTCVSLYKNKILIQIWPCVVSLEELSQFLFSFRTVHLIKSATIRCLLVLILGCSTLGCLVLCFLSNIVFYLFIQFTFRSVRLSVMSDSATLWTVACQAPLSMEFSRQDYWSGLPFISKSPLLMFAQMTCAELMEFEKCMYKSSSASDEVTSDKPTIN